MPSDLSALQRNAVEWAAKVTARAAGFWLDLDERRQIAALAVLSAEIDTVRSDSNAAAFLGLRARGAVLDELRLNRRHGQLQGRNGGLQRAHAAEDEVDAVPWPQALEQPERREELRRVAAAVELLPPPRPLVALRLAEGASCKEIAKELGVSESRVSQCRRDVCEFMWEMTTCLD